MIWLIFKMSKLDYESTTSANLENDHAFIIKEYCRSLLVWGLI